MAETCIKCRFFVDLKGHDGVCRRYPARPVLVHGEQFAPGDSLQGYWPRVGIDDWCGEWDANEVEREQRYRASMAGDF